MMKYKMDINTLKNYYKISRVNYILSLTNVQGSRARINTYFFLIKAGLTI